MTNRLLDSLGLSMDVLYYSDTVILYQKGDKSPFGCLFRTKDGHLQLHVGSDVPDKGHRVEVSGRRTQF